MNPKKARKLLLILLAALCAMAVIIYAVGLPRFRQESVTTDTVTPSLSTGEITDGTELRQRIQIPTDELLSLQIVTGTYQRSNTGELILRIQDEEGNTLSESRLSLDTLPDSEYSTVLLPQPITGRKGQTAYLSITSEGCTPGNAVTLYSGSSVSTGRIDIAASISPEDCYKLNGKAQNGKLCLLLSGINHLNFYQYYWLIAGALLLTLAVLGFVGYRGGLRGKKNAVSTFCIICDRYYFLIKQLVIRDFKTKYKRSVLGVAWSFLNPLLSMAVQYVVFSTLFKSNIENYPVYLLTGIVFFNFFSEVCSLGMVSITDNAALIKKVYLPKYVYPLSRVISSLINFTFSLIPLFGVILLTGTAIHASVLLLIFDVLCYAMFLFGMVLILSTMMTFFQDTRFIWTVLSMIWMYLTPIFYPESIIPARFAMLYHLNPLYQFITFARTCIISGVSPAPASYLWCLLCGVLFLTVGILIFRRHQDQFVLNL